MNSVEWTTCRSPERMLNSIRERESRRKLRLFSVACCRRLWSFLTDERSRLALDVIENHADGKANDAQLQAASEAAKQAFQAKRLQILASIAGPDLADQAIKEPGGLFPFIATQEARHAHDAADNDPASMAASAVWSATASDLELQSAGFSLTDSVIGTTNQATAAATDVEREESAQAELLRDIFGDPFLQMSFDSQFMTTAIVAESGRIYDSRDFGSLSMLANALEAAGCRDVAILEHCRSTGPHVIGCWVIDLMLGKQ